MKCPLIVAGYKSIAVSSKVPGADCLKEECAWWSPAWETCFINVFAIRLTSLQDVLEDIEKKMPHEGQFRT